MFEIFPGKDGQFWWRLKANNHEIVAGSTEGYDTKSNARRAIGTVRALVPAADVVEVDE